MDSRQEETGGPGQGTLGNPTASYWLSLWKYKQVTEGERKSILTDAQPLKFSLCFNICLKTHFS